MESLGGPPSGVCLDMLADVIPTLPQTLQLCCGDYVRLGTTKVGVYAQFVLWFAGRLLTAQVDEGADGGGLDALGLGRVALT